MTERGKSAHYGFCLTLNPESAPLRSLTWPSLATFQTFSLRSLRFESRSND